MKSIDEIFEPKGTPKQLLKQKIVRLNKGKRELRMQGFRGKEFAIEVYKLKRREDQILEKGVLVSYRKANKIVKAAIHQHLLETGKIHNFVKRTLDSRLHDLNITTQQFEQFALHNNLFGRIYANIPDQENRIFPCQLVSKNIAWISMDQNGVYRYFTKRKNGRTIGFNIFDFIETVDGIGIGTHAADSFIKARQELAKMFHIQELHDEWSLQESQKYEYNLDLLQDGIARIKQRQPVLYEYIKSFVPLLILLNYWGKEHIYPKFRCNGESVLFVSSTELKNRLGDLYERSTITRAINMFALIGILIKIPHTELSDELWDIAKGIHGGRKGHKFINFYQIPRYSDEILAEAEQLVMKLLQHGMSNVGKITKEKIETFFGKEYALRVFPPTRNIEDPPKADNFDDIPF